jgi:hypothetical protein
VAAVAAECTSSTPFLPRYHFIDRTTAPKFPDNANDVNALFYYGGYYHVMYQTQIQGKPRWTTDFAHLVSRDLATWVRLPDALQRGHLPWNSDPDGGIYDGAFSLLLPPHGPVILYEPRPVKATTHTPLVVVRPSNLSDPLLTHWQQNVSAPAQLNISTKGPLKGWRNSSKADNSLECVPSSIWLTTDTNTNIPTPIPTAALALAPRQRHQGRITPLTLTPALTPSNGKHNTRRR